MAGMDDLALVAPPVSRPRAGTHHLRRIRMTHGAHSALMSDLRAYGSRLSAALRLGYGPGEPTSRDQLRPNALLLAGRFV